MDTSACSWGLMPRSSFWSLALKLERSRGWGDGVRRGGRWSGTCWQVLVCSWWFMWWWFFCHYAWLINVHRLGNLVVGNAETWVVLVQSQQQNRSCNKLLKQNKTKTNYYNYSGKLHWIPPSSKNWVWNWNIFVKQCANGGCDSWSTSAYNHTWSCMDARTTTNCGDEKTTTIIQKWTQLHPRNKLGLMFVG